MFRQPAARRRSPGAAEEEKEEEEREEQEQEQELSRMRYPAVTTAVSAAAPWTGGSVVALGRANNGTTRRGPPRAGADPGQIRNAPYLIQSLTWGNSM